MSDADETQGHDTVARQAWIDELCDRYEDHWRASRPMTVADFLRLEGISADPIDQDLLRELARLEAAYAASPPSTLNAPARDGGETAGYESNNVEPVRKDHDVGETIAGRYRLLEMIGEGGMGSIWKAEQSLPIKRLVAVKLIRNDLASNSILTRFEAERQALAVMDHPHIAKVLDAGSDRGRPYFVMELVNGVPLTRYCDEHRLTLSQRLDLFQLVCHAVQHAHQKGVIHRDLKPANILVETVNGLPSPKVIDFGLAKAVGERRLTENSLETNFGAILGTPLYMSPEQAVPDAAPDIDTRADIYALGVILYELLTGTTPILKSQIVRVALFEILRMVRELEPPIPSSRIVTGESTASVAAIRQIEPKQLGKAVRGDLDWIVMKALAKSGTAATAPPRLLRKTWPATDGMSP